MRLGAFTLFVALALLLAPPAWSATYASPGGDLDLRLNGSTVELVRDGSVVASDAPGADWTIQGADGVDDALTVHNPAGGVLKSHVSFDGGNGGFDVLNVGGGKADTSAFRAAGPDSGSVEATRGPDTLTVAYAGLEPVNDLVPAANLTYNDSPGGHSITIDNGVSDSDGQVRIDNSASESIEFANKTNVTVDGGDGTDFITVANSEAATGLTGTMTVTTGPEMGESISVDDANYAGATLMLQTTGAVTDLNAGANNVTASSFGAHAGTGIVLTTTVSNLELDTDTGPLSIFNTGAVTVGGVSSALHGLR